MADTPHIGNIVGIAGGTLAIVGTLAAGFISYGRLQTLVETQAATNAQQAQAIETLTSDLHGFQDFFMDFLASRGVTQGPLDPSRYYTVGEHTHEEDERPNP